ncbi:MAG: hypothetical protein N3G22_01845 [Candidatus Micrarchaeota archaeon]|nr:hypothetical protein [Candidatus Micrarchaeota archaeon]
MKLADRSMAATFPSAPMPLKKYVLLPPDEKIAYRLQFSKERAERGFACKGVMLDYLNAVTCQQSRGEDTAKEKAQQTRLTTAEAYALMAELLRKNKARMSYFAFCSDAEKKGLIERENGERTIRLADFWRLFSEEKAFFSSHIKASEAAKIIGINEDEVTRRVMAGKMEGEKRHNTSWVSKKLIEVYWLERKNWCKWSEAAEWLLREGLIKKSINNPGEFQRWAQVRGIPHKVGIRGRRLFSWEGLKGYEGNVKRKEEEKRELLKAINIGPHHPLFEEGMKKNFESVKWRVEFLLSRGIKDVSWSRANIFVADRDYLEKRLVPAYKNYQTEKRNLGEKHKLLKSVGINKKNPLYNDIIKLKLNALRGRVEALQQAGIKNASSFAKWIRDMGPSSIRRNIKPNTASLENVEKREKAILLESVRIRNGHPLYYKFLKGDKGRLREAILVFKENEIEDLSLIDINFLEYPPDALRKLMPFIRQRLEEKRRIENFRQYVIPLSQSELDWVEKKQGEINEACLKRLVVSVVKGDERALKILYGAFLPKIEEIIEFWFGVVKPAGCYSACMKALAEACKECYSINNFEKDALEKMKAELWKIRNGNSLHKYGEGA